jgi:hypothetical protein
MTYRQLLEKIINKSFVVGKTFLQSSNCGQVLQGMTHKQDLKNGKSMYLDIVPLLDPYQMQSTMVVVKHKYGLDKNTTLILNSILPSTTLVLYLFPNNPDDSPKPIIESSDYIMVE